MLLAPCSQLFFDSSFKLPNKLLNNLPRMSLGKDERFVKRCHRNLRSRQTESRIFSEIRNRSSLQTSLSHGPHVLTCCIFTDAAHKIAHPPAALWRARAE